MLRSIGKQSGGSSDLFYTLCYREIQVDLSTLFEACMLSAHSDVTDLLQAFHLYYNLLWTCCTSC